MNESMFNVQTCVNFKRCYEAELTRKATYKAKKPNRQVKKGGLHGSLKKGGHTRYLLQPQSTTSCKCSYILCCNAQKFHCTQSYQRL